MSIYLINGSFFDQCAIMNAEDMLYENLKNYRLIGDNLMKVDIKNLFPPGPKNASSDSFNS